MHSHEGGVVIRHGDQNRGGGVVEDEETFHRKWT